MKISIDERVLHFRQPARTSRGVYTERRIWLVSATEDGRTAMGECAPLPDLSCDAMAPDAYQALLRHHCDLVEQTGTIDYAALRDLPSMLFGLETALEGLGRQPSDCHRQASIPINGLVWMGNRDEMLRRIDEKLEQGYRCVKLKVGAIDFEEEIGLLEHIRRHYAPHDLQLRLDANGAFQPDEALYRLELLSQYAIHSIEQPVKARQWGLMARLCREAPLPIALDEELIGVNEPEQKRQMLRIIKPAYIVLKPSLHGGISGTREWVRLATEEGIGSWITSALESNVGLYAIARLCLDIYGATDFPQGLGTGQLFTDNIPMPLEVRNCQLCLT